MYLRNWFAVLSASAVILLASHAPAQAGGRILYGEKQRHTEQLTDNKVQHHSLAQRLSRAMTPAVHRKAPWSLPMKALDPASDTTVRVLVLRFDFQYEETDDPNTTGRGVMNLGNPLNDPVDSAAYYDSVGHWIDPPPHDSLYFDAHLRALRKYWETVTEGAYTLDWDIYPPAKDSTYKLPGPMSDYGICYAGLPANEAFDTVIFGLVHYFRDCVRLADTVSPEIDFSQYQSVFLFHAGSDSQTDIGFPPTCSDLFTGFINYVPEEPDWDTVWVDGGAKAICNALILPESNSQDNRATALNAVLAHEFGHQLGLVDLYRTDNFISCLGDFALMDHNGFGTSVDFGFDVGGVFGTIPVYPCAWSRAYLGVVEVHNFRQGTDIEIAAAEVQSESIKIARVPISEKEYYLIENRVDDLYPEIVTGLLADSITGVIQYPVDTLTREFTGEYDFLLPGSGLLIYHVDESVAALNYDSHTGDTVNNFYSNQLQLIPSRRFISLVEADGVVDMSGYYQVGSRRFGWEGDMFREDREGSSLTPNTNPAAIDNSGNNTHIWIDKIRRAREQGGSFRRIDTLMRFDVRTRDLVDGFPVRAGYPSFGFAPICDNLDKDPEGAAEIIFASGRNLCVITSTGENFLHQVSACDPCRTFYDTSLTSVYADTGRSYPIPLFARTPEGITANPVTGDFGLADSSKYIAVGSPNRVDVFRLAYNDQTDLAQRPFPYIPTSSMPVALSFGNMLYILDDAGRVYLKPSLTQPDRRLGRFVEEAYHGICRIGDWLILLAGDSLLEGRTPQTRLYCISATDSTSITLNGYYNWGPITVDVDLDGLPEVVVFGADGKGLYVTADTLIAVPPGMLPVMTISKERETGFEFTVNPVAGDIDLDGYPDIVIGGRNAVYAFSRELTLKTGYPLEIDDRIYYDNYAHLVLGGYQDEVISSPVVADIESGGSPEIVFPTFAGNVYSFGPQLSYGFPLSGGERGAGSPVVFYDENGGRLGYLGYDGWFYAWEAAVDSTTNFWPMGGHDASGSFVFDQSRLSQPTTSAPLFAEEKFYNYPNPVLDGATTIRYYLGREAKSVRLTIYDLSGREIDNFAGPTQGAIDNEKEWNCSGVTPGVYRCMIEVDFGAATESAFTDIAIIR